MAVAESTDILPNHIRQLLITPIPDTLATLSIQMSSTTAQPPQRPSPSLADLHQARASLAQEIELLKNAFVQLKDAEARFKACNTALDQLAAGNVSTMIKQHPNDH